MGKRLKITVTLEKETARWARTEAAKAEMGLSSFLAGILEQRMAARDDYEGAMRRALGRKPFLKTDVQYLSRDEVHDRAAFAHASKE